jgi:hypothetical protein
VRLAEQLGADQAGRLRGIHQPLAPVLAPVGGAGEDDLVRLAAEPLGDVGGHPGEQRAGELLGAEPLAVEQDRHLVAQPPFELPGDPGRLADRAAAGRVPDQHDAVVAEEHHRRDLVGVVAERHDLRPSVAERGGGREGRADIDAEHIGHGCDSSQLPAGREGRPERPLMHVHSPSNTCEGWLSSALVSGGRGG